MILMVFLLVLLLVLLLMLLLMLLLLPWLYLDLTAGTMCLTCV